VFALSFYSFFEQFILKQKDHRHGVAMVLPFAEQPGNKVPY